MLCRLARAHLPKARKAFGWPRRCKLARAFVWEYSYKRLKLAHFLGQLGGFLTGATAQARSYVQMGVRAPQAADCRASACTRVCRQCATPPRSRAPIVCKSVSVHRSGTHYKPNQIDPHFLRRGGASKLPRIRRSGGRQPRCPGSTLRAQRRHGRCPRAVCPASAVVHPVTRGLNRGT